MSKPLRVADPDTLEDIMSRYNVNFYEIKTEIINNLNAKFLQDLDLNAFTMFGFNKIVFGNISNDFEEDKLKYMVDYFNFNRSSRIIESIIQML